MHESFSLGSDSAINRQMGSVSDRLRHAILSRMGELTVLLHRWSEGDESALGELMPLVYDELKRPAGYYLQMEAGQASLTSTAIVHEAYLRLASSAEVDLRDRQHFCDRFAGDSSHSG